jgi:uncharacterized protein YabN with tetrapyrrole methylase and pyrophosphatase domain
LAHAREELGDVLFSAVNVARVLPDCDAEEALTAASDRFYARFAVVERMAAAEGTDLHEASVEELDRLWGLAKALERAQRSDGAPPQAEK